MHLRHCALHAAHYVQHARIQELADDADEVGTGSRQLCSERLTQKQVRACCQDDALLRAAQGAQGYLVEWWGEGWGELYIWVF
jgi:hypothetical protein